MKSGASMLKRGSPASTLCPVLTKIFVILPGVGRDILASRVGTPSTMAGLWIVAVTADVPTARTSRRAAIADVEASTIVSPWLVNAAGSSVFCVRVHAERRSPMPNAAR